MPKDEKVVNPPKNPTVKSKRKFSGKMFVAFAKGDKNPRISAIKKLPSVFTNKVPKGNAVPNFSAKIIVAKYRQSAPSPPPKKT